MTARRESRERGQKHRTAHLGGQGENEPECALAWACCRSAKRARRPRGDRAYGQAIAAEVSRPDLIGLARRIAEAELDLRRARRARQTPARLTTAGATGYRLIESPNSKLFRTVVRRLNRRKESWKEDLTQFVFSTGWVPGAPEFVEAPARRARTSKLSFSSAMSGARRRVASPRSVISILLDDARSEPDPSLLAAARPRVGLASKSMTTAGRLKIRPGRRRHPEFPAQNRIPKMDCSRLVRQLAFDRFWRTTN